MAGCFAFIALRISCYCKSSMMPWVGLRCVIVVFPDQIHLLFASNAYKS